MDKPHTDYRSTGIGRQSLPRFAGNSTQAFIWNMRSYHYDVRKPYRGLENTYPQKAVIQGIPTEAEA